MAASYTRVLDFADALANWSGKPLNDIPPDQAPCGYIRGASEENYILAFIFARLCALPTSTERMTFLLATIEHHRTKVRDFERAVRGESNPRLVGAQASREAWSRLRPIEAMIEALETWRDDLLEAWSSEVGVRFIDQAARRSA